MQENKIKPLKDLRLLDRFLFAELMEDEECSKEVLEIILGKDISLLSKEQTEKEIRTATWLKSIRLYVYSVDEEGTVYDTEMRRIIGMIWKKEAGIIRGCWTALSWNRERGTITN